MRIMAVLLASLGIVLFVAPEWASPNFLWKVSPFVAMTMGGWYLGNGIMAWEVARVWRWSRAYGCLAALWSFSLLEAGVLVLHRANMRLDAVLGWPYVAALSIASIISVVQIADWVRLRPSTDPGSEGEPMTRAVRVGIVSFAAFVGFLAIMAGLGFGQGANIFPQPLTTFTIHAFGAFYLSLAIGAVTVLPAKRTAAALTLARTGLVLIIVITSAAVVYAGVFDIVGRPGQLLYWAAYVVVGIILAIYLWRHRATRQQAAEMSGVPQV
jgi:hypothetical protein